MSRELDREVALLENDRKMTESALRGHQVMMAEKLNGAMGRDILNTFEKKERKPTLWRKIINKFDKFLMLIQ